MLIIPPIVAPGAGSILNMNFSEETDTRKGHTGKNNGIPFSLRVSLISTHPIPGWHTKSESASSNEVIPLKPYRKSIISHHE